MKNPNQEKVSYHFKKIIEIIYRNLTEHFNWVCLKIDEARARRIARIYEKLQQEGRL